MAAPWDADFERLVRRAIGLPADQPLDPATSLAEYGLRPYDALALLTTLERHYRVILHDDPGVRRTLATPATLWAAVADLLVEA